MLKVKSFEQEKTGFCGPASLKMVLDYFGIKKSEGKLAKLSGCTKSKGVEAENLLKAAKELGFKGFIKDFSKIEDIRKYVLRKKIPIIVDWFSSFFVPGGHYSVVVDIDKKNIYLQDPEIGRARVLPIETFKKVWFDFLGKYLRSKNDIIIRRLIIIFK